MAAPCPIVSALQLFPRVHQRNRVPTDAVDEKTCPARPTDKTYPIASALARPCFPSRDDFILVCAENPTISGECNDVCNNVRWVLLTFNDACSDNPPIFRHHKQLSEVGHEDAQQSRRIQVWMMLQCLREHRLDRRPEIGDHLAWHSVYLETHVRESGLCLLLTWSYQNVTAWLADS